VWVLSEYFEEHTWPSRFASAPDMAGTWDPWSFFAAGIWFIILVIHALRAYLGPPVGLLGRYFRRPIAKAELDREVERLKGRRCRTRPEGTPERICDRWSADCGMGDHHSRV
jgi:hypothetical protein